MLTKEKIKRRIIILTTILIAIIVLTILSPYISPFNPIEVDMNNRLARPNKTNWLGTDNLGRDLFSRLLNGGRASLWLAFLATTSSMLLGLVLGLISGYFGGKIDILITMISNIFQGLPSTTLMIVLVGILEPSDTSLVLALTITSWIGFSRYVRAETIKLRSESYIESLKALGASDGRIIIRGILPNILGGCLVMYSTRIGRMVLSISGLSYLGIGIQAPRPDWGKMVSESQRYIRRSPNLFFAPALCIIIFSFSINLLGDALRDYLDIKNQTMKVI